MTVGHNIIALFSYPDRKVRNVPKRLLNGVMEFIVGSQEHWRARFDEVLQTLPPKKGYLTAGETHSDLSYVGKNNGFPVSSHDLNSACWVKPQDWEGEWTKEQRREKHKRLLLAWKTEPRYWIDWVNQRANGLELKAACAENGIDVISKRVDRQEETEARRARRRLQNAVQNAVRDAVRDAVSTIADEWQSEFGELPSEFEEDRQWTQDTLERELRATVSDVLQPPGLHDDNKDDNYAAEEVPLSEPCLYKGLGDPICFIHNLDSWNSLAVLRMGLLEYVD